MEKQITLAEIQAKVKVPKNQRNTFGNYNYRSCEDIVEEVKKVITPLGFWLVISDEIVVHGTRFYIKATATITDGTTVYTASALAREEETKKGMDAAQITGATSSYARKYALNGLLAIDDTKDADSTQGQQEKQQEKPKKEVNKPAITDAAFTKAVERMQAGEKGILENLQKYFTLTEAQVDTFQSLETV